MRQVRGLFSGKFANPTLGWFVRASSEFQNPIDCSSIPWSLLISQVYFYGLVTFPTKPPKSYARRSRHGREKKEKMKKQKRTETKTENKKKIRVGTKQGKARIDLKRGHCCDNVSVHASFFRKAPWKLHW